MCAVISEYAKHACYDIGCHDESERREKACEGRGSVYISCYIGCTQSGRI